MSGIRVKEHLCVVDALFGNRDNVAIPPALASAPKRSQLAHGDDPRVSRVSVQLAALTADRGSRDGDDVLFFCWWRLLWSGLVVGGGAERSFAPSSDNGDEIEWGGCPL